MIRRRSSFRFNQRLVVVLLALTALVDGRHLQAIEADVVLVGGTLVDGTGEVGVSGDIAIRGDRIVAVGKLDNTQAARTIECTGLIVSPGFIDLHNHSDFESSKKDPQTGEEQKQPKILEEQLRPSSCYLTQGCTTIVTGNCGGGAVEVDDFYNQLDANRPGVNVAHLLPAGALRNKVIGMSRRGPTPEELDTMRTLAGAAMQAGAWGMSTGLQYVPGSFAETDELVAIAEVVGRADGIYASHMRDEGDQLLDAVEETIEIGRRANLPVHISHFKASKQRNWGKVRAAAKAIEVARAAGRQVTADQYPYIASSTTITAMLLPDEEREGGKQAVLERLSDPKQLQRLRPIVQDSLDARGKIMIASCPQHPAWTGKTIREVAVAEQRAPVEVALDVIRSGDEQGVNFAMDERDVRFIMTLPWAATASDGSTKVDDNSKPHPRSFGTFPRRIGRYAIEQGVVAVERAIRSATGLPADIIGFSDRGYLRQGYVADIVVFDPQSFRDQATFQSPFEVSTGVRWLLVNGQVVIDDGELIATAAGRPLRKVVKDR
ncbi:MAG: N-acyl-D-amino-acid deacylase family protein [Bythopirellula sp.]